MILHAGDSQEARLFIKLPCVLTQAEIDLQFEALLRAYFHLQELGKRRAEFLATLKEEMKGVKETLATLGQQVASRSAEKPVACTEYLDSQTNRVVTVRNDTNAIVMVRAADQADLQLDLPDLGSRPPGKRQLEELPKVETP